ncbi:MAG: hypothetical protein ACREIT_11930, partial [Tepidisphaeraceae bacterium]
GLALLRIDREMHYLPLLAERFAGGEVSYTTFATGGIFGAGPQTIAGRAPAPPANGDVWTFKLERQAKLPGGPVVVDGKVIGMAHQCGADGAVHVIPADQIRAFLGEDRPIVPSTNPDPKDVTLQLTPRQ